MGLLGVLFMFIYFNEEDFYKLSTEEAILENWIKGNVPIRDREDNTVEMDE